MTLPLTSYFDGLLQQLSADRRERRLKERPRAPAFSVFGYIRLRVLHLGTAVPGWLDACRKECEAASVAAFLADFAAYLRSTFGGLGVLVAGLVQVGRQHMARLG